jgi:tryptophanyl-tRNA synthetase
LWFDVNGFYRQSDVPQTAELSWYLSCFLFSTTLAHSFKDKATDSKMSMLDCSHTMLMAIILLYDAQWFCREDQFSNIKSPVMSPRFNPQMGGNFRHPEAKIQEDNMLIPGTNGGK